MKVMLYDDSRRVLKVLELYRAEALLAYQRLQTVVDNPGGPKHYTSTSTLNVAVMKLTGESEPDCA